MVQDNTRELEDLSEGRLKGRARPCASAPVADTASASGSALMRVRFLTVPESNSTRGALAYGLLITLGGQRLFLPEHTPPHCQGERKQVEETWYTGRATSGPAGTQV